MSSISPTPTQQTVLAHAIGRTEARIEWFPNHIKGGRARRCWMPQILPLIPISRSARWAGIREGKFPQGIKLGGKATVWRAEDIRHLIERSR